MGMTLSWKSLHGLNNTSKDHCQYIYIYSEYNILYNPQMQDEAICEHDPETLPSSLGKAPLK